MYKKAPVSEGGQTLGLWVTWSNSEVGLNFEQEVGLDTTRGLFDSNFALILSI